MSSRLVALIHYLMGGGHYSVIDIANDLHIGDPRSAIRDLRNRGITVEDEWVSCMDGQYKRYWIERSK